MALPDWTVGDSVGEGEAANLPLAVSSCDFQAGELPSARSFVELESRGVRLVAMKRSQDGAAVILRLAEVEGEGGMVRLRIDPLVGAAGSAVTEVDAMERALAEGGAKGTTDTSGGFEVAVPAYGITSIRVG